MSYAIIRNTKYKRENLKGIYRQLQDAFYCESKKVLGNPPAGFACVGGSGSYKYMVENGFDLQRGLPKEETNRKHYSVEEYKKITNFKETIDKFITWICKKFDMGAEDYLIRDFEKETNTFIDPEKQIKKEEWEKEWELER